MIIAFSIVFFLPLVVVYFYLFYPRHILRSVNQVFIKTTEPERYKDDCLHPCIRFIPEGFAGSKWWMVQSPYYGRNNKLENPVLYHAEDSNHPLKWNLSVLVQDTPEAGFNSDPVIYYENHILWIFWREKSTPLCENLNISSAIVGVKTIDGKRFSPPKVFLTQQDSDYDAIQCPIIIKNKNRYHFYTVNYQYSPKRESKGITIWEGSSLEEPDFFKTCNITVKPVFTVDKWKQLRIFDSYLFIPKPLRHDLWHFDLFEYKGRLFMFSVAEWGDNIMISVSRDYKHFKTYFLPVVNTHCLEQMIGYRSYLYKPTGYIKDDILYLYYTLTGKENANKNVLYFSKVKLPKSIIST